MDFNNNVEIGIDDSGVVFLSGENCSAKLAPEIAERVAELVEGRKKFGQPLAEDEFSFTEHKNGKIINIGVGKAKKKTRTADRSSKHKPKLEDKAFRERFLKQLGTKYLVVSRGNGTVTIQKGRTTMRLYISKLNGEP